MENAWEARSRAWKEASAQGYVTSGPMTSAATWFLLGYRAALVRAAAVVGPGDSGELERETLELIKEVENRGQAL